MSKALISVPCKQNDDMAAELKEREGNRFSCNGQLENLGKEMVDGREKGRESRRLDENLLSMGNVM